MNTAGNICFRGLSRKNPISKGCASKWIFYCLALRRSNSSIATTPLSPPHTIWLWSLQQQALKFDTRSISSHLPAFGNTRSMGSGASKDRNKKGIANGEGEQQQQQQQAGDEAAQGQVENPVYNDRGTSEQQQRQQEAPTDQQAAESEVTMAEEYVEAVVAKASDFGDNE